MPHRSGAISRVLLGGSCGPAAHSDLTGLDLLSLLVIVWCTNELTSSRREAMMLLNRGLVIFFVALLLWAVEATQPALAAQVVAIGASNTIGAGQGNQHGGVVPSEAWPAQLEQLLHAHGANVQVKNAGIAGDTTCNMLSRLDGEIGPDTKVVIIQPGGNDSWKGACRFDRAQNVAEMQRRLRSRGIKPILLLQMASIAGNRNLEVDGQHFNKAGHAAMAAWLLPKVVAALR